MGECDMREEQMGECGVWEHMGECDIREKQMEACDVWEKSNGRV